MYIIQAKIELYSLTLFPYNTQICVVFRNHRPPEALVFEVGYHPREKIHVIKVVFQD